MVSPLTRRQALRLGGSLMGGTLFAPVLMGTSSSSARRILVIGAGAAGIAAAQRLLQLGWEVQVIEARDRLGGRVCTTPQGWDLGAGWIHGQRGNPLVRLARQANATTVPFSYAPIQRFDAAGPLPASANRKMAGQYQALLQRIRRAQNQAADAASLASITQPALQKLENPARERLRYSINTNLTHEYAADPPQLSLAYFDDGAEQLGGDLLLPQGYVRLLENLLPATVFRLNEVAQRISWHSEEVLVETSRSRYQAAAAIITLPLGVLRAGTVKFSPELPAGHRQAMRRLGVGTLNKLFLRFPHVAWPKEPELFGYVGDGWWEEWVNYAAVTGEPLLVGFNGGRLAEAAESFDDQALTAAAMKILRRMFGPSLPDPIQINATRWHADPFALGSYSHYTPGSTPQDRRTLATPIAGRLFLAGEACSVDHPATVHGAWTSGIAAAENLHQTLRTR